MIPKIKKINIIASKEHRSVIVDLLHKTGFVQIEESPKEKKEEITDLATIEYSLAGVKFSLDFLKKFKDSPGTIWERLTEPKISLTLPYLEKIGQEFYYQDIIKQCESLENEFNRTTNKIEKLKENEKIIRQWQKLNLKLDGQYETNTSKTIFGNIKSLSYPKFDKGLKNKSTLVELKEINEIDKESYLVLTLDKRIEKEIKEIITKYDFKIVDLPRTDEYPQESINKIGRQIKEAREKTQEIITKIKKLLKYREKLQIIFDYLTWQKEKTEIQKKFSGTKDTFLILGWVIDNNLPKLKDKLNKITQNFEIIELPIKKGENIPVVIENKKFITPFEAVTNIYGLPQTNEPDPTPYLAPFFILFFGLALTDAGYGILLALISWLAIKIMRVPKENQKLFRLLIYGGISTFILGILFGGWFGIIIDNIPGPIGDLLTKLRIINPAKEPIKVLILTFILGIIQVLTGIALAIWWKIKNKEWVSAVLDHGLWFYFICAILFWTLTKAEVLSSQFGQTSLWLVWTGVIALVLTQGRSAKNIVVKLLKGVLSLYGLVGYFSDILSYSRLLALGLATGIIAMVINLIAVLARDMLPYVGWILMIIILVGGHLFNLIINTLGAFIHSGRLQFVEFFSKFMEGGGSRFKPFKQEAKYITIKE